jgi:hypothetical protein
MSVHDAILKIWRLRDAIKRIIVGTSRIDMWLINERKAGSAITSKASKTSTILINPIPSRALSPWILNEACPGLLYRLTQPHFHKGGIFSGVSSPDKSEICCVERAKLGIGIRVIVQIDVGERNVMVVSPSWEAALGCGLGDELCWL